MLKKVGVVVGIIGGVLSILVALVLGTFFILDKTYASVGVEPKVEALEKSQEKAHEEATSIKGGLRRLEIQQHNVELRQERMDGHIEILIRASGRRPKPEPAYRSIPEELLEHIREEDGE